MSRSGLRDGPTPNWIIFILLFLVRIPFLLIHHVQEDAYITFRTARHLAEQGDFSYNLHQHFPGTTSLIYPFMVSAIDLVLHRSMVQGVQLLGVLCVVVACYLAARAWSDDRAQWQAAWLLLGCWPISLVVSYTGMETPLLLLALGAAMYAFSGKGAAALFPAAMLSLMLIRPDAIAYGVVFCAAMPLVDRQKAVRGLVGLATGCGLLLVGNRLTTGQFLPTTSRAKEIAYHPSHAVSAILGRIHEVFLHQSFLLPVSTSYLTKLSPVLLVVLIAAFAFAFRKAGSRRERILLGAIAFLAVTVPAAYAAGGVIFDWYLFPANWLAASVVVAVGVRCLSGLQWRTGGWVLVGLLWLGMAGLQWARSLAESTEDYHYRGDIGRYLGEISHGQGKLFLEPAGYIPYYSELETEDEVGLVSGRITDYMLRDANKIDGAWWIDYVQAEQPDYIVQRESFTHYKTFEDYTLTPAEQQWFDGHYKLIRRTHYDPLVYHPSPYLRRILALTKMPDYLVYQKR